MQGCYNIMVVRINNRANNAVLVQDIFTRYGCMIRTRLGLHEGTSDHCTNDGLVLLQLCGELAEIDEFLAALHSVEGVKAKFISMD